MPPRIIGSGTRNPLRINLYGNTPAKMTLMSDCHHTVIGYRSHFLVAYCKTKSYLLLGSEKDSHPLATRTVGGTAD